MLSEAVRRRLELLNRQPIESPGSGRSPALSKERRDGTRRPAKRRKPRPLLPEISWLAQGEVVVLPSGPFYRIRVPLGELWEQGPGQLARQATKAPSGNGKITQHPELQAFANHFPHQTLFLDLETCGFAGSALFLIGLLRYEDHQLVIDLLMARNYAEERAVLEMFWRIARSYQVLVTFNGKCFDWPMICDRTKRYRLDLDTVESLSSSVSLSSSLQASTPIPSSHASDQNGIACWAPPQHCDLVHHARRIWKRMLPNCKLQTLERVICGRHRTGDIPGNQIPDAYHDFVRTGSTERMDWVLHHNALDLVTLADLAVRISRGTGLPYASAGSQS